MHQEFHQDRRNRPITDLLPLIEVVPFDIITGSITTARQIFDCIFDPVQNPLTVGDQSTVTSNIAGTCIRTTKDGGKTTQLNAVRQLI